MKLSVYLEKRSYPIFINEKPEDFYASVLEFCPATKYAVVTNDTIFNIYENHLSDWKRNLPNSSIIVIPDGEKYKNMKTLSYILDETSKLGCDRKSAIIAFGGGVVGDVAGFAASIFMRGINYVQVPTTLLAAVDSSVGGKTAVNNSTGKNLIGTFWQPKIVWIDTKYSDTLLEREYFAGCGEIAKYAYIGQKKTFEFITRNFEKIRRRSKQEVQEAIIRSVKIKAGIVSRDETEAGDRALLNFGHTFAHAFEKIYGYGALLHGEAVILGIHCAVKLATRINLIRKARAKTINESLKILKVPAIPHKVSSNSIYRAMFSDKKRDGEKLKFVLPTAVGKSEIFENVNKKDVISVLDEVFDSWIF